MDLTTLGITYLNDNVTVRSWKNHSCHSRSPATDQSLRKSQEWRWMDSDAEPG